MDAGRIAILLAAVATLRALVLSCAEPAEPAAQPPPFRGPQGPPVVSPEVSADRHVTFRIQAPKAEAVRLIGNDIPGNLKGPEMTKGDNGVWEVTLGPIEPGAYRYNFNVDGVSVIDPRSPSISESYSNVWSLVCVPGSDFMDTKDVPHGSVAEVTYYSKTLTRFRRMHIYTPPGYESGKGKYPVFYLLHGGADCDDSWSSVGRAGFILDNLIAAGKAKPMVLVMPACQSERNLYVRSESNGGVLRAALDEFAQHLVNDIMPCVEKNYRVRTDQRHRAIAGLSMGGVQTLDIAIRSPGKFAYVGVFSSGILGITGGGPGGAPAATFAATWEEQHKEALDSAESKKGLKLLWFATDREELLIETSRATVDVLGKRGFDVVYNESPGDRTWISSRNYLNEFTPQLFQGNARCLDSMNLEQRPTFWSGKASAGSANR